MFRTHIPTPLGDLRYKRSPYRSPEELFPVVEELAFPPHPLLVKEDKFYLYSPHVKFTQVLNMIWEDYDIELTKQQFLTYYFPVQFHKKIKDAKHLDYIKIHFYCVEELVTNVEFEDIWTISKYDSNNEIVTFHFRNEMDAFKAQLML